MDLGGKELQRTLQAAKEPERRSGLLGNAKHGSPNTGLPVFSRRVKERFPNTHTLCTYCAFQKRKLLSKVKLRHTLLRDRFSCGNLMFGELELTS